MYSSRSTPGHLALIVGHPAATGGMETFCRFLARTAIEAGWQVTVGLSGANIYGELAKGSPRLRVEQLDWIDGTCAGDRPYRWSDVCKKRTWFRRVRPDVAVFVQSSNTPFRASLIAARLAGVRVITTQRTMAWPIEHAPSHRHFFGLVPGIGLHRRKLIAKAWLTAAVADRVVYNSLAVRRGYEELYHYPVRNGLVIPNAVNAPSNAPCSDRPADEPVTIGFVGRIGADKQIDVLLRAVAAMNTRPAARLLVYGEGADQYWLATLVSELGIADRVTWAGVTDDVWSAYRQMDIVALCSPRESSSNMVLEAMAAGKAVVVTQAGGSPELIEHGRCGICVPAGNVPVLTLALEKLAGNADLRAQLGSRARARAIEQHDPRAIGQRWLRLLNETRRSRSPQDHEHEATAATGSVLCQT